MTRRRSTSEPWRETLLKIQFTRKQQLVFLEDLNALMQDGIAPSQAIGILCETTKGIRHHIALHLSSTLAQGQQLAFGMQDWFCHIVIEMIHAGETSGTVKNATQACVSTLKSQQGIKHEFLSHLTYPTVVFVLACILTVFIKHSVLNAFLQIKPLSQWPSIGVSLLNFAKVVQDWWWLFGLVFLGLGVFLWHVLRDLSGAVRSTLDKLPLFKLYREAISANFMQMLGQMLSNGVALKRALTTLQQDAHPYFAWHLVTMEFNLSGGYESISDVIHTGLISADDLMRLSVVARTRGFAKALARLGQHTQARVTQQILSLGKLIGALLLVASGLIAATTIFAIYSIGSIVAT